MFWKLGSWEVNQKHENFLHFEKGGHVEKSGHVKKDGLAKKNFFWKTSSFKKKFVKYSF